MTDLRCPKCSGTMRVSSKNDCVRACEDCGGRWIDLKAHEAEIGDLEPFWKALAKVDASTDLACPVCVGEYMEEVEYAGAHLDACAVCHGIYFDAGELDAVRKAKRGTSLVDHGVEAVKVAGEIVVDSIVGPAFEWVVETAAEIVT